MKTPSQLNPVADKSTNQQLNKSKKTSNLSDNKNFHGLQSIVDNF